MNDLTRALIALTALILVVGLATAAGASGAIATDGDGAVTLAENETTTNESTTENETVGDGAADNGTDAGDGSADNGTDAGDGSAQLLSWRLDVSESPVLTEPTVADGVAYVGSLDGNLYAIDAEQGTAAWDVATGEDHVVAAPTVHDGDLYVGALENTRTDGTVQKLNATTGEEAWSTDVGSVEGSPIVANGTVYVASLNYTDSSSTVHALNASTGTEQWNVSVPQYVLSTTPQLVDGTLYVSGWDAENYTGPDIQTGNGQVAAIDVDEQEIDWTFDEPSGELRSAPTVADGTVYVGSGGKALYALDASSGNLSWTFDTTLPVEASPTVVDDTVYVGETGPHVENESTAGVYAVNATTGEQRWSTNETAAVAVSVAVDDQTVFVGDESGVGAESEGTLHAIDAATGAVQWSFEQPTHWIRSPPTVHDGAVYFGNQDGNVYTVPTSEPTHDAAVEFAADPTTDRLEVASNRTAVELTAENSSVTDRDDLTATWSVGDDANGVIEFPATDPWNASYELAAGDAGATFDVALTLTNQAGQSDTASLTVSIEDAEPPEAALEFEETYQRDQLKVDPDRAAINLTAVNTTDPEYDVQDLTFDWSLDDAAAGDLNQSIPTSENWTAAYDLTDADAGTQFNASLTVTNEARESDTTSLEVVVAAAEENDGDGSDDGGSNPGPVLSPGPVDSDDPAAFDITIDGPSDPLAPGESLDVEVTVENTGDETGTATLDVEIGGEVEGTVSATLDGGEQTTDTVSLTVLESDDQLQVDARSSDGTVEASTTFAVEDSDDDADDASDGDDDDSDDPGETDDTSDDGSGDSVPGFGVAAALVGLLLTSLAVARRQLH